MERMEVTVTEQEQGPFSSGCKLFVSVLSKKISEPTISPEIIIKNLAIIRFQFRVIEENGRFNQPVACSISFRKHSPAIKDEIKMSLYCELLDNGCYSERWVCTEYWSTWYEIGNQSFHSIIHDWPDVYLHIFEFKINAYVITPNMFAKLYEDKDFTDFRLSCAEGSVTVHKACLASHSDMFKTMLTNEWKESTECLIEPEVTLQTLQQLKDYLYLGSPQDTTDSSLRQLLLIAKHYKMKNLQGECVLGLAKKVTATNLYELFDFAKENEIRELTLALIELTPINVIESISQSLREL